MNTPPERPSDPLTGCLLILIAVLAFWLLVALAIRAPA